MIDTAFCNVVATHITEEWYVEDWHFFIFLLFIEHLSIHF